MSDVEKAANINWLTFLTFGNHSADAFLYKDKVWAHDQLYSVWRNTRKKHASLVSKLYIRPKYPKNPIL